ncbi:BTAD domain-containing putative transcriptional regulator [Kribbella yunnanensis]|uniref:BTAD domain-containing putative transcriptional regulator n=1 Tax=Kribbella yunnanensis TaxID=190194 RepID=A0ABP4UWD9_9ACTN
MASFSPFGGVPGESYLFRVLGPFEVGDASRPVRIPPGRQEVVLAALVLNLNRVVDVSSLVDLVWGEDPPATARTQIQICVSGLRKILATGGVDATVETRAHGYLLIAPEDSTDLNRFRGLVRAGRELARAGDPAAAIELLRAAEQLWRGPSLTGLPHEAIANIAASLDESRIEALEVCLRLELELGRHEQLVSELQRLVAEHPLRERLRGHLMVALHRSGRQAEALESYQQVRRMLADELGLDPGKDLRDLADAILADDPDVTGGAEATGGAEVEVAPALAASERVVPRQLPADVVDFVADDTLIKEICTALTPSLQRAAATVVLLTGGPGVGKTTMATHVAYRLADDHYPDGQLYCDLRGTCGQPLGPAQVLGRFLRALGLPGQAIPEPLDERAELYRSLLADRRILVVLDDADNEAQVRPLLPGSGRSAVAITSRNRLTSLPINGRFGLEPLGGDLAVQLLGQAIGESRVLDEADAARVLVQLVGGLPLALRIIAARLAARPHWPLSWMVRRLQDEHLRLDELAHGELSIRASLRLSYEGLAAPDRRLLCLLALADGTTMPSWVGAALADDRGPSPADLLDPLIDLRLLEITAMDSAGEYRCSLPQTVRMFAHDRLTAEITPADQAPAIRRLVGGWTALVEQAHLQIYGGPYTIVPGQAEKWHLPADLVRRQLMDPLAWLESEHENLANLVNLAAKSGLDESCWQLATTLVTLFEARGYPELWESTHRVALEAVRAAGNLRGQAAVLRSLGALHLSRGEYGAAGSYLDAALKLFVDIEDPSGRALCHRDQALIQRSSGADDAALAQYELAEQYFITAGDIVGRAHVLVEMAHILIRMPDFARARSSLDEALGICRSVGFDRGQALALRRLGQLLTCQGEFSAAERTLQEVLAMVRASGDLVGEGHILHDLGRLSIRLQNAEQAMLYLTQAVTIRESLLDTGGAAAVRADITTLLEQRKGQGPLTSTACLR